MNIGKGENEGNLTLAGEKSNSKFAGHAKKSIFVNTFTSVKKYY